MAKIVLTVRTTNGSKDLDFMWPGTSASRHALLDLIGTTVEELAKYRVVPKSDGTWGVLHNGHTLVWVQNDHRGLAERICDLLNLGTKLV